MRGLLSEFALGPAWARAGSSPQILKPRFEADAKGSERGTRRGEPERGPRERDERRPSQGRRENYADRREGPPQAQEAAPAPGVRVMLNPDPRAIHLIGREVHQVARVYPLFEIARILLAERGRCRAVFEVEANRPAFFHGRLDDSLFLTRDEAIRHLWHSDLSKQLIEEETIEVDPPSGRFQAVARCGLSGVWLGPPNHHSYQTNLRRLHRERFGNMPFEAYASKVRTERSEEAVNAWLETMKQKVRWRIKGEDENAWMDDRTDAERAVATRCFETAYAEVRTAEVSGGILASNLSPALLTSLRVVGSHASQHPAILIPAVCRALEAEHLPVFKRLGKLHTGPARPHALAPDLVLAERPAAMVEWIRNNKPAKLAGLWQAVLPEGVTDPTPEYAADLFWLLHQGHILLYPDDKLAMQESRVETPPKTTKAPKKPRAPRIAPIADPSLPAATDTTSPSSDAPTGDDDAIGDATDGDATDGDATDEFVTDEDATDEDATDEDATDEDATDEDATDESATDEEATDEEATDEEATDEDATDEDATDEDATDEPATDESATDESATDEPATDESATDEFATDEPATDGPATDEFVTNEFVTNEFVTNEQLEIEGSATVAEAICEVAVPLTEERASEEPEAAGDAPTPAAPKSSEG
jgi:hypothetical protein